MVRAGFSGFCLTMYGPRRTGFADRLTCAFPLPFTASLKKLVFFELVFFELVPEHPPRRGKLMMMVESVVMLYSWKVWLFCKLHLLRSDFTPVLVCQEGFVFHSVIPGRCCPSITSSSESCLPVLLWRAMWDSPLWGLSPTKVAPDLLPGSFRFQTQDPRHSTSDSLQFWPGCQDYGVP